MVILCEFLSFVNVTAEPYVEMFASGGEQNVLCFAENKILVIVMEYLLVNSVVQMICRKLQTGH